MWRPVMNAVQTVLETKSIDHAGFFYNTFHSNTKSTSTTLQKGNVQPEPIFYPESDGKPMADNTIQYKKIVMIKENLELLFANNDNVFIAADLFWYPVEGNPNKKLAPDVMVAFERPKGDRGSYLQWNENNIAPHVVFEILSPNNTAREMREKFNFYEKYGVEEYYVYDPDKVKLEAWKRSRHQLKSINTVNGWISPRLNIRFDLSQNDLFIFFPDGQKFLSFIELDEKIKKEKNRADEAEQLLENERIKLSKEMERVEKEKQRAEKEKQRAEKEKQRAEKAESKMAELLAKLKELNIDI